MKWLLPSVIFASSLVTICNLNVPRCYCYTGLVEIDVLVGQVWTNIYTGPTEQIVTVLFPDEMENIRTRCIDGTGLTGEWVYGLKLQGECT